MTTRPAESHPAARQVRACLVELAGTRFAVRLCPTVSLRSCSVTIHRITDSPTAKLESAATASPTKILATRNLLIRCMYILLLDRKSPDIKGINHRFLDRKSPGPTWDRNAVPALDGPPPGLL